MMGNALNHLYDFILMERVSAFMGEKSNEAAQANIDSLYTEYEKIYKNPTSTSKEWFGETYYKWSTFSLTSPLENMLKLDIPILYVAGGEDRHSILNMDYAKLEFLRKGKNNLTYKVFPNCDHFFLETKTDEYKMESTVEKSKQDIRIHRRATSEYYLVINDILHLLRHYIAIILKCR